MDDTKARVQEVFREIFDNEKLEIFDAMQAKDVKGWDSLTHVTLIVTLEENLGIKFSTREVMGFQNVGEMLVCVSQKLKK